MGNVPPNAEPLPPSTLPPAPKLNDGEIAGIVIGSLIGFIIISIIIGRDVGYIKDIPAFLNNFDFSKNEIVLAIQNTLADKNAGFSKLLENSEYRETLIRYSVIYIFILIIMVIMFYASYDRNALSSNSFIYSISIIVPLILIIYFFVPQSGTFQYMNLIITGIAFLIVFMAMYFYITLDANSTSRMIYDYVFYGIIVFIILLILSITFLFIGNYLKSLTGLSGFVVYFIFYIPCLLIDFIKYIRKELNMTTNIIYILFFLEIFFVLLYIYYPQILRFLFKRDGILLLKDTWYLDHPRILTGTSSIVMMEPDPFESSGSLNVFRREYSISLWINLNPQPTNYNSYSKETPVFCYGADGKGKPLITYYYDKDSVNKDKLLFYFSNNSTQPNTSVYIDKQKWNNIVVNYKNQICDVFINGQLESSSKLSTENLPTYDLGDTITIGAEEGLYGAVCNIKLFFKPLTKMDIVSNYNLLMNKNPPTPIS